MPVACIRKLTFVTTTTMEILEGTSHALLCHQAGCKGCPDSIPRGNINLRTAMATEKIRAKPQSPGLGL